MQANGKLDLSTIRESMPSEQSWASRAGLNWLVPDRLIIGLAVLIGSSRASP